MSEFVHFDTGLAGFDREFFGFDIEFVPYDSEFFMFDIEEAVFDNSSIDKGIKVKVNLNQMLKRLVNP